MDFKGFIEIDPFAACLPEAGLAPLRAKKEDLPVHRSDRIGIKRN